MEFTMIETGWLSILLVGSVLVLSNIKNVKEG